MTYSEIPQEAEKRIRGQLVLDAYDIVGKQAIGDDKDYERAYIKLAIIARYEKEQAQTIFVNYVVVPKMLVRRMVGYLLGASLVLTIKKQLTQEE
jgi:hypothetical protein